MKIDGVIISESIYDLEDGRKGKIAVLFYTGKSDPTKVLDYAVSLYVSNNGFHQLIDANLDNPWMRVILSNINDLKQFPFDSDDHQINKNIDEN